MTMPMPAFSQKLRACEVLGGEAYGERIGIALGFGLARTTKLICAIRDCATTCYMITLSSFVNNAKWLQSDCKLLMIDPDGTGYLRERDPYQSVR
jgi:hypothetical protein